MKVELMDAVDNLTFYKVKEIMADYAKDNTVSGGLDLGETHEEGRSHHPLTTYLRPILYQGTIITVKWNRCSACRQVRNIKAIAYEDETNASYERVFKKRWDELMEQKGLINDSTH